MACGKSSVVWPRFGHLPACVCTSCDLAWTAHAHARGHARAHAVSSHRLLHVFACRMRAMCLREHKQALPIITNASASVLVGVFTGVHACVRHIDLFMSICVSLCHHMHALSMYICTYMCVHIHCLHTHARARAHTHTHAHINYVYTHTHTHTHTHTADAHDGPRTSALHRSCRGSEMSFSRSLQNTFSSIARTSPPGKCGKGQSGLSVTGGLRWKVHVILIV